MVESRVACTPRGVPLRFWLLSPRLLCHVPTGGHSRHSNRAAYSPAPRTWHALQLSPDLAPRHFQGSFRKALRGLSFTGGKACATSTVAAASTVFFLFTGAFVRANNRILPISFSPSS